MKPVLEHPWDLDVAAARALQDSLRHRVEPETRMGEVRHIAGADISYDKGSDVLFAAVVVLDVDTLTPVETRSVRATASFPYVPGYLSFREIPPLVKAMEQLSSPVDLIVCDGQGLAHPRRFGLACHLGVLFDVPTIGCAKSLFIGTHRKLGEERGRFARLMDKDEVIGCALRTRDGVKPLYVSIGHRISLPDARRWVLRLTPHWRQPETTRHAHGEVNRLRALEAHDLPGGSLRAGSLVGYDKGSNTPGRT